MPYSPTLTVVFTGPAVDSFGRRITRQDLTAACIEKGGLAVQPAITPDTAVLVASRLDTQKARRAAANGIPVLTYPEFIAFHLRGVTIASSGVVNSYTDLGPMDPELLVPVFDDVLPLLPEPAND